MNALAVIVNLIFPGIGQMTVGHKKIGLTFAVLFCLAVDALVLSPILAPAGAAKGFLRASAILVASIWLWSNVRLLLRVHFLSSAAFLEHKENMFRKGVELFLRNELAEARDAFTQILALDNADADAHLYLGLVYKNLGQYGRARTSLRRCARYDYQRRWRWETDTELATLKERRA